MAAKASGTFFVLFRIQLAVENIPKPSFFFSAQFRQLFEDFFDAHCDVRRLLIFPTLASLASHDD